MPIAGTCVADATLKLNAPHTAAGRVVDLHALRHTFGTRLGMNPAIDPKSIQTLMRHSTPTLTFKLYVHPNKERLRNAVASLPEIKTGDGGDAQGNVSTIAV